jgi:tRNA(Ile)-lysidine synthase
LVCALNKLKEKQDFQIKLVHVNYHQREDESNNDEKFVRNFAEENGLNFEVFDYNQGGSKNLEEDMRNFRYKVFEEVLNKDEFNKIAVGHTKDDSVETFLMNLIRGSGVEGITSLRDQRGRIIRPLMCCEKSEILDFLKGINQEFCTDKSNFDIKFSRSKILPCRI